MMPRKMNNYAKSLNGHVTSEQMSFCDESEQKAYVLSHVLRLITDFIRKIFRNKHVSVIKHNDTISHI